MTKGLRVTDLRLNVSATGDDIVDEVRISIEPGKVLALVGESGSGKTTVGLAVLGHSRRGVTIVHGRVECADTEVLGLSEDAKRKIRGELVSYVPQDPASSLNPALRIGVQLMEALEVHDFGGSVESRKFRLKQMMAEHDGPEEQPKADETDTPPQPHEDENPPAESADTGEDGEEIPQEEDRGDQDPDESEGDLQQQIKLANERIKNAQARMTKATQEAADLRFRDIHLAIAKQNLGLNNRRR